MYKNLSKSEEIMAKLRAEGKVRIVSNEEIASMNEYMEEVHQDYIRKSRLSEISASDVWITIYV
jgi:hypothetical protein